MLRISLTGTVINPAEAYETADGRQLHRFDALATSDFIYHGDLVQQSVRRRVILTERLACFADHITRGRRIFIHGNLTIFRHTDAEGVDREQILVMAHFVELQDRPATRRMAEEAVEEAALVRALFVTEDDLAF